VLTCVTGTTVLAYLVQKYELTEELRGLKAHPAEDAQVAALKVITLLGFTDTKVRILKQLCRRVCGRQLKTPRWLRRGRSFGLREWLWQAKEGRQGR
jgi:hypothetical protein